MRDFGLVHPLNFILIALCSDESFEGVVGVFYTSLGGQGGDFCASESSAFGWWNSSLLLKCITCRNQYRYHGLPVPMLYNSVNR